jgi:hypothetical protein
MYKMQVLLIGILLAVGFCIPALAQTTITIGTATSVTGASQASPINISSRSLRGQMVVTKAELNAAGVYGTSVITQLGFYIASPPAHALPSFVVRLAHTTASDAASHNTATLTTVYSNSSYMPVSGGFQLLTFSTPFSWNGNDNLLIDTAFGRLSSTSNSGSVRYTALTNGYRYTRGNQDQTNSTTTTTVDYRPNVQLTFAFTNPQSLSAAALSQSLVELVWAKNLNANNVMLAYNTTSSFGSPVNGTSYSAGATISGGGTVLYNGSDTQFSHSSLNPQTTYYYKAWSVDGTTYSPGVTASATTLSAPITSFPFLETFEADSATRSRWTQIQETSNHVWTYALGAGGGSVTTAHGGSLNARFTSSSGGPHITKLVSPVLDLSSIGTALVSFYYAQELWYTDQNELKIYYRTSPVTPWVEIGYTNANVNTWTYGGIELPNLSSTYQIAFEGIDKYGRANVLDDVKVEVFPPALGLDNIPADFGIVAVNGSSAPVTYNMSNVGGGTLTVVAPVLYGVNADQYELTLNSSYPATLANGQSASFTLKFKPTSQGVKSVYLLLNDNLGKSLYALTLNGEAMNVVSEQNFDSFPAFSLNLNPWTLYDGDGKTTYPISGVTFPNSGYTGSFIAFNPSQTTPALTSTGFAPLSGTQYAACFAATTPPNNDWLISPALSFGLTPKISFFAKSVTSTYGLERFSVWVSTTNTSIGSFTKISTGDYLEAPTGWTGYRFALPENCANNPNVYVAIQCVSNNAFALLIDDFKAGDYPSPMFTLTPGDYNFGAFYINYTRSVNYTIKNNGGDGLTIPAGGITLTGSKYFKVRNIETLPVTLNSSQSFTFQIEYLSSEEGNHSATLSITDNLARVLHTVTIEGATIDNTVKQLPYFEGFEESGIVGWVTRDADADGRFWYKYDTPGQSHSGTSYAASWSVTDDAKTAVSPAAESFLQARETQSGANTINPKDSFKAALTPDNWIISPPFVVGKDDSLTYWVGAYNEALCGETYTLYASTANPTTEDFLLTPLFTETLTTAAWQYRSFNLDNFDGNIVYFAIRHHNSTNNQYLKLDEFKVLASNTEINQSLVVNNEAVITINPIEDLDHNLPVSVGLGMTGLSSTIVTANVGYGNPTLEINNPGMHVYVTGGSFYNVTFTINHNLGFTPPYASWRVVPGTWNVISASTSYVSIWNNTTIEFTLPSAKADGDFEIVFPPSGEGTLPVELSYFSASVVQVNKVLITWVTQSETNLSGYRVYRSGSNQFADAIQLANFIPATNTSQQQTYVYTDSELSGDGTYYYWLEHLDMDGGSYYHGPVSVEFNGGDGQNPGVPVVKGIAGIYPNPFNPDAQIRFGLTEKAYYSLKIYNARGQLVRNLSAGNLERGYHTMLWNGRDDSGRACSSGFYFAVLNSGKDSFTRKMTMVK